MINRNLLLAFLVTFAIFACSSDNDPDSVSDSFPNLPQKIDLNHSFYYYSHSSAPSGSYVSIYVYDTLNLVEKRIPYAIKSDYYLQKSGDRFYFIEQDNILTSVHSGTDQIQTFTTLPDETKRAAISSDEEYFAYQKETDNTILVINPNSGEIIHEITYDVLAWLSWSPDDRILLITSVWQTNVFDIETAQLINLPTINGFSHWSYDSEHLLYRDRGDDRLSRGNHYLFNLSNHQSLEIPIQFAAESDSWIGTFSPDKKLYSYLTSPRNYLSDLHILDVSQGKEIVFDERFFRNIAWFPNSKQILYTDSHGIHSLNLENSSVHTILEKSDFVTGEIGFIR